MGALRAAVLVALVLLLPLPVRAELARVEAVGSVPLGAASKGGAAARQEALEAGIREAVERSALELAKQAGSSAEPDAVRAAIGDPKALAASWRILEDRGERAPLLEVSPGAEREYVVAVEVEVDRARVRSRLAKAGLLPASNAPAPGGATRIVLEGVDTYGLWTRIRAALAARGGSVHPLEFAPGRIVAELGSPEASGSLVSRLAAGLGEAFEVQPLGADGDALRIGIVRRPDPSASTAAAAPGAAAGSAETPAEPAEAPAAR